MDWDGSLLVGKVVLILSRLIDSSRFSGSSELTIPWAGVRKTNTDSVPLFSHRVARGYQLRINLESDSEETRDNFDGFRQDEYDAVAKMVRDFYDSTLENVETSVRGWNWGEAKIEDNDVRFYVKDKLAFEMPVAHIANSNIDRKSVV